MAPSIDCTTSLFCAEDVSGSAWAEDTVNQGDSCRSSDLHSVLLDFPAEDEEAISMLLQKESRHMPEEDYLERFRARRLTAGARQNAITWMLKVQAFYNFGPLCVALSVNYMDRFLSSHQLPVSAFLLGTSWKVQLLSVACMSLAAKMEETEVPFLLDLQVEEVEHIFEARTIQRMELLVLSTLGWRMSAVTPFSYIDYYLHKLGIDKTVLRFLLDRVIELILGTLKDVNFLAYRPSVIAAAAVLCSVDEVIPVQALECRRSLRDQSIEKRSFDRCFQLMQEVLVDPSCSRCPSELEFDLSSHRYAAKRKLVCISSVPQSPVGVLEAATLASWASESTPGSRESSPSVSGVTATPLTNKKRRQEEFCFSFHSLESL